MLRDRARGGLLGMFIGDALAMPVHWYYDREQLRARHGEIIDYVAPKNPHPNSILWRSSYSPPSPQYDMLGDQAKEWGKRDVHYHQNLPAGGSTLNLQLARLALLMIGEDDYSPSAYAELMFKHLTSPEEHKETYVEEWARGFMYNRAEGKPLLQCGVLKEKHIGGLAGPLAVYLASCSDTAVARKKALLHLLITHGGQLMAEALEAVLDVADRVVGGATLRDAVTSAAAQEGASSMLKHPFAELANGSRGGDLEVIGDVFSPACYVEGAVPAALYLAYKYSDQPEKALIANTMAGGDNCYRGVVVGALIGLAKGEGAWPKRWVDGLAAPPPLVGAAS